jgi:hypothetical protein
MTKQRRSDNDPLPEPADPLADFDLLKHGRRMRGNNRRTGSAYPYVGVVSDDTVLVVGDSFFFDIAEQVVIEP